MGESVSFLFDKKWSVSMNNEVVFSSRMKWLKYD